MVRGIVLKLLDIFFQDVYGCFHRESSLLLGWREILPWAWVRTQSPLSSRWHSRSWTCTSTMDSTQYGNRALACQLLHNIHRPRQCQRQRQPKKQPNWAVGEKRRRAVSLCTFWSNKKLTNENCVSVNTYYSGCGNHSKCIYFNVRWVCQLCYWVGGPVDATWTCTG